MIYPVGLVLVTRKILLHIDACNFANTQHFIVEIIKALIFIERARV
ncbi:hypothetical protein CASFOL_022866 [Castilleja foliolosa]|uniref:Uncharacterized protein n=1 Tax=Castilleja foliolosa TaxID=1961234 RepID=A0ABD3CW59_9LAMI